MFAVVGMITAIVFLFNLENIMTKCNNNMKVENPVRYMMGVKLHKLINNKPLGERLVAYQYAKIAASWNRTSIVQEYLYTTWAD